MPPPLFIIGIPGLACFFLIQILVCQAYHFHVTLARTKKYAKPPGGDARESRAKDMRPRKSGESSKGDDSGPYQDKKPSPEEVPDDRPTEGSHSDELQSPKEETNARSRRKSVFAESYDPSKDDSAEKIVNPKTLEEKQWLIDNVRNVTLFQHLANDQVTTVVDAMHKHPVQDGELIMRQGDKGSTFYVVQTGVYHVYKRDEDKDEDEDKLVHTYDNEGSFGELALLYHQPRAATVVAKEAGVLWAVDGVTFRRIVNRITYQKRMMYESLINNVRALRSLEPYERANLVDALIPLSFEHDQQIIKQGDDADGMYFIISGGVRIVVKTPQDKDILVKELSNSEYFGELALVTKNPRAASAYAVGPTHLAFLEREAFERLLGPCMDVMRRQIDRYNTRLSEVLSKSDI